MAFPTPPMKLTCPKCGWSQIQATQGDVRLKKPITKCPKCGCEELESEVITNPVGKILADLFGKKF